MGVVVVVVKPSMRHLSRCIPPSSDPGIAGATGRPLSGGSWRWRWARVFRYGRNADIMGAAAFSSASSLEGGSTGCKSKWHKVPSGLPSSSRISAPQ